MGLPGTGNTRRQAGCEGNGWLCLLLGATIRQVQVPPRHERLTEDERPLEEHDERELEETRAPQRAVELGANLSGLIVGAGGYSLDLLPQLVRAQVDLRDVPPAKRDEWRGRGRRASTRVGLAQLGKDDAKLGCEAARGRPDRVHTSAGDTARARRSVSGGEPRGHRRLRAGLPRAPLRSFTPRAACAAGGRAGLRRHVHARPNARPLTNLPPPLARCPQPSPRRASSDSADA